MDQSILNKKIADFVSLKVSKNPNLKDSPEDAAAVVLEAVSRAIVADPRVQIVKPSEIGQKFEALSPETQGAVSDIANKIIELDKSAPYAETPEGTHDRNVGLAWKLVDYAEAGNKTLESALLETGKTSVKSRDSWMLDTIERASVASQIIAGEKAPAANEMKEMAPEPEKSPATLEPTTVG